MLLFSRNTKIVGTRRLPSLLRASWPKALSFHPFKSPTFDHLFHLSTMSPRRCLSKRGNLSSAWFKSRGRLVSTPHQQLHHFHSLYIIGPDISIMVFDMVFRFVHIWIHPTLRQKVIRLPCLSTIGGIAYDHSFDFRHSIIFPPNTNTQKVTLFLGTTTDTHTNHNCFSSVTMPHDTTRPRNRSLVPEQKLEKWGFCNALFLCLSNRCVMDCETFSLT